MDFRAASDARLVVALGRYGEDALAEIYRRHAGPVHGLARRVLGEAFLAEEVVQEVFVTLWRKPEVFDAERGSLRSFLLAMSHRRAVDVIRSESARKAREERDATRAVPDDPDKVEREVWDLAVSERVREAVAELDPPSRQAIELAYFGGLTYREAAERLGEPEGTVKSRIRGGLRRMRSKLVEAGMER